MTENRLKLIVVTRVKNEADIIEPFVRHHAAHFDKLIVLDDGSTDATWSTLRALQEEGLPLVLLRHPTIGYDQRYWMSKLAHLAASSFGADWIAPLDADEFIELRGARSLQQILSAHSGAAPIAMPWCNFAWDRAADQVSELNAVVRLDDRLPQRDDSFKVMLHSSLLVGTDAMLWQGNHGIKVAGVHLESVAKGEIVLCHYPIRSSAQYTRKLAIGYLQYAADPKTPHGYGIQYHEAWPHVLAGGEQWLSFMEMQSRQYSHSSDVEIDRTTIKQPLKYAGGALKLTPTSTPALTEILHFAEKLAGAHRSLSANDAAEIASRQRDRNVIRKLKDRIRKVEQQRNRLRSSWASQTGFARWLSGKQHWITIHLRRLVQWAVYSQRAAQKRKSDP